MNCLPSCGVLVRMNSSSNNLKMLSKHVRSGGRIFDYSSITTKTSPSQKIVFSGESLSGFFACNIFQIVYRNTFEFVEKNKVCSYMEFQFILSFIEKLESLTST